LQLTVNEPRPVLDKPIGGFVVPSKELDVSRRLEISTGTINETPRGGDPIMMEARPRKRFGLERRVSEDISIWQLNVTIHFVKHPHSASSPNADATRSRFMIDGPRLMLTRYSAFASKTVPRPIS
jgi:hypothetical protein